MKNVLIYGVYNSDNLGDDYMMYQVSEKLKREKINPIFIKTNNNKINYFKIDNIDYIPQNPLMSKENKFKRILKIIIWLLNKKDIANIDAIIFMGGGYTNEDFSLLHLTNILIYELKFKLRKKKIYFTGQTVGPFNTKKGRFLIKKIYKLANKVFVREEYSKRLLDDLNIKSKLVGDDAFLVCDNINDKINIISEDYAIFNYKDFKGYEKYKNEYFSYLLDIAKKINIKIKILPFRSQENSREVKINYKLYEFLKENNIEVDFCIENDIKKFNEILENAKLVIGTAYHSIVLGLIFNNAVYSAYLGDYYKMKIDGILNWYGYNQNCLNLEKISENNLDKIKLLNKVELKKQKETTSLIANNVINAWNEIVSDIKFGENI